MMLIAFGSGMRPAKFHKWFCINLRLSDASLRLVWPRFRPAAVSHAEHLTHSPSMQLVSCSLSSFPWMLWSHLDQVLIKVMGCRHNWRRGQLRQRPKPLDHEIIIDFRLDFNHSRWLPGNSSFQGNID